MKLATQGKTLDFTKRKGIAQALSGSVTNAETVTEQFTDLLEAAKAAKMDRKQARQALADFVAATLDGAEMLDARALWLKITGAKGRERWAFKQGTPTVLVSQALKKVYGSAQRAPRQPAVGPTALKILEGLAEQGIVVDAELVKDCKVADLREFKSTIEKAIAVLIAEDAAKVA